MPDVYITERDGHDVLLRTVPNGKHEASTVAVEMATVAQKAYDLGRAAEGKALESAISAAINKVRCDTK